MPQRDKHKREQEIEQEVDTAFERIEKGLKTDLVGDPLEKSELVHIPASAAALATALLT